MSRWEQERLSREGYPGPGVDLPVLYGDLDTNVHLNNVQLGRFFEHARVLALHGLYAADALDGGTVLVGRVAIDYVGVGRFGTPLHVRTRVGRVGTTSAVVEQAAWQHDRVIGLCEVVMVLTRDERPLAWPEAARALLRAGGAPGTI